MQKPLVMMMSLAMLMTVPASAGSSAPQERTAPACAPAGSVGRLAGLPEASGLAVSRSTPGRLWSHNDSGKPEITALDAKGNIAGRLTIRGATLEDWEAIASGTCGRQACLFVADIGDNDAKRGAITVYRLTEPAAATGTVQANSRLRASYPDGSRNAETLLVAPDGTLHIVTKGDTGPVALYRFPRQAQENATMRLEPVGTLSDGRAAKDAQITDGTVSLDGEWVVLRTANALKFYRAAAFFSGTFREVRRVDLSPLAEPQGEAVAFGPSNTLYLAGEGKGEGKKKSEAGTFAVVSCNADARAGTQR